MAMLRGSVDDLRTERASVDTGTGEKRLAQGRDSHVSRGNFVNFYDDLGISTSQQGADTLRAQDKAFGEEVTKRQGEIKEYTGKYQEGLSQVEAQKANLPDINKAYNDAWNTYKTTSLVPVRPEQFDGEKYPITYVPQDVVNQLAGQNFRTYTRDGVTVLGYTEGKNAQKHDAAKALYPQLVDTATSVKNQFTEQVMPTMQESLNKAQLQIAANEKTLATEGANLDIAGGMLKGAVEGREADWKDIRDRYDQRKETMREILGGLSNG